MSVLLAIFIIVAFVAVLIFAIALCRAASLGDEAQRLARRVTEDEDCPECRGKGIVYSDPDGQQLVCGYCDGTAKVSK